MPDEAKDVSGLDISIRAAQLVVTVPTAVLPGDLTEKILDHVPTNGSGLETALTATMVGALAESAGAVVIAGIAPDSFPIQYGIMGYLLLDAVFRSVVALYAHRPAGTALLEVPHQIVKFGIKNASMIAYTINPAQP